MSKKRDDKDEIFFNAPGFKGRDIREVYVSELIERRREAEQTIQLIDRILAKFPEKD